MPDDFVVVQTRDRTGRTIVSWYPDVHEAERCRPIAWVGGGQLHVEEEAPVDVTRRAVNLFRDELTRDPRADLSHVVTHAKDSDGYVHPIAKAPGGQGFEDARNLTAVMLADRARNFGIGASDG